ncbi:hypothetical protein E4U13_006226 [Claviceps humidiphila]|uniref:non-specific serine/threonine protein kinase n=1 Tax=Claviceps humidiphila TaxID=1294629 RepID=A0A9P7PW42_9HYPO|nr:hypothetical protein E4U13_006226 [Claviceps humidiphila]
MHQTEDNVMHQRSLELEERNKMSLQRIQKLEQQIQEMNRQTRPSTFCEFFEGCHGTLHSELAVQSNVQLETNGSTTTTYPTDRPISQQVDFGIHVVHMLFLSWGGHHVEHAEMVRFEITRNRLIEQAEQAMKSVHDRGVVHQDVRWENVLFNPETKGELKDPEKTMQQLRLNELDDVAFAVQEGIGDSSDSFVLTPLQAYVANIPHSKGNLRVQAPHDFNDFTDREVVYPTHRGKGSRLLRCALKGLLRHCDVMVIPGYDSVRSDIAHEA